MSNQFSLLRFPMINLTAVVVLSSISWDVSAATSLSRDKSMVTLGLASVPLSEDLHIFSIEVYKSAVVIKYGEVGKSCLLQKVNMQFDRNDEPFVLENVLPPPQVCSAASAR